ncbi:MAG TPA: hypothetical protein VGG13_01965 [Candidatus Saccharimonadales bacterium]|jgi:hypothetical protein
MTKLANVTSFFRIKPEPVERKSKTYRFKGKDGKMHTVTLPAPSKHLMTITKGL